MPRPNLTHIIAHDMSSNGPKEITAPAQKQAERV